MILKCKMCGGDLGYTEGMTVCECEYCGTIQTVNPADEKRERVPDTAFGVQEKENVQDTGISPTARRGHVALEGGDFKLAEMLFGRALEADPADAYANLGVFLVLMGARSLSDLQGRIVDYEGSIEVQRAKQFGDEKLRALLAEAEEVNRNNIDKRNSERKTTAENKKKVFSILFYDDKGRMKEAEEIFQYFKEKGSKVGKTYSIEDMFSIISHMGTVLSERKMHLKDLLIMTYGGEKSDAIAEILDDLKEYGFIEAYVSKRNRLEYCLPGVKQEIEAERLRQEQKIEEDKRRRKQEIEAERRRQEQEKQAWENKRNEYRSACEKIERDIRYALKPEEEKISRRFDTQIEELKNEMGTLVARAKREQVKLQMEIFRLKGRAGAILPSDIKKKETADNELYAAQKRLSEIESPESIKKRYRPQIDRLEAEKKTAIEKAEKEVRTRFSYPQKSVFGL